MATANQINNIIVKIIAIQNFAKDIHYNTREYGDHLLADKVIEDLDVIDDIKENVLLGNNAKVPASFVYLDKASKEIPELPGDTTEAFKLLSKMLDDLIKLCNGIKLDRGDSSLIDGLCEVAKKGKGLLWIRTTF